MAMDTQTHLGLSQELLDAIQAFPVTRRVEHCGEKFTTSPLDVYATCPRCGVQIKVRAFSATAEIEDVIDAVLLWLNQPEADELARRRQLVLAGDD